jgi:sigma-B regulation protein RsbU (phosphoserine phosphatase)
MARMLAQTDPKQEMLEKSLKLISRIIPAERLAILYLDDNSGDVFTAANLLAGNKNPGQMQLSRTIIHEIITNRSSVLIGNVYDDPKFSTQKSIIMSEVNSAMAVPLFEEERVLGILYVDTTQPFHRYNDDYLRVLATFGNIIASRLINYNLLEERQARELLNAELKRASKIQEDLLVTALPEVPNYGLHVFQEQSRSVGGDLYDLQNLPNGQLLLMVADVSGKGLGAALLMSNILASFRIQYTHPDFDLAQAVTSVSLQLCNYSKSENFATLFAAVLDYENHVLKYVNAGHNPPLLVHSDGSLEQLEATGMMIGAFDFATWEENQISLSSGDLVFVFTDGVTEADNGNVEEQFGDERLLKLAVDNRHLTPDKINLKLLEEVDRFVGDAPRSDDITTLILKRE